MREQIDTMLRPADEAGRRWLFVMEDPLSDATGPLAREQASTLGILRLESH